MASHKYIAWGLLFASFSWWYFDKKYRAKLPLQAEIGSGGKGGNASVGGNGIAIGGAGGHAGKNGRGGAGGSAKVSGSGIAIDGAEGSVDSDKTK